MNESHHWGWMFVVLAIFAGAGYLFTLNRPDNSSYGNGSVHNEPHRQDWPLSIHIGEGSCSRTGRLEDMINTKTSAPKQEVKK